VTFDDPAERGPADPRLDPAGRDARLRAVVRPRSSVPGWATVELDRAEREAATGLGTTLGPGVAAPDDSLLGARCRILRPTETSRLVLLEPATEGHLAAALARHGEGWLVTWLLVDAAAVGRALAAGFRLSPEAAGPLGQERRVLGGPRHGPFILLAGLDPR
jgi:hypothetical protein